MENNALCCITHSKVIMPLQRVKSLVTTHHSIPMRHIHSGIYIAVVTMHSQHTCTIQAPPACILYTNRSWETCAIHVHTACNTVYSHFLADMSNPRANSLSQVVNIVACPHIAGHASYTDNTVPAVLYRTTC